MWIYVVLCGGSGDVSGDGFDGGSVGCQGAVPKGPRVGSRWWF